jgi:hypothetical protein
LKRVILILALAAAPVAAHAAAHAPRITLNSLHVLCSTEATADRLNELRGNSSAWTAQVKTETAQKSCTILPKATNVWVERRAEALTCVRGDDMPTCGWTVLDGTE